VQFNPTTVGMHASSIKIASDQGSVAPQVSGTGTANVTVTKVGTGSVADTLATPIISCGTTCSGTYSTTPITLHATITGGIPFDSWGGACSSAGSNADCTLSLTSPSSSVTATFGICKPGTGMCASGMLQTCDSTGHWTSPTTCTLGCFTDNTRCWDVAPSNGLAAALDDAKTQPSYTLTDGAQFDTNTGNVIDGNGSPVAIKSVGVAQTGAPSIRVFEVGSLTTGAFTIKGSGAFAIASNADVSINGVVSVVFQQFYISPGAVDNTDPCSGVLVATGSHTRTPGAGGGSFSSDGARGGTNPPNTGSAAGTAPVLSTPLSPLRGGCPGGLQFDSAGQYGAGGGAMQIVSRTVIKLTGNGVLNMGGGGASGLAGGHGGGGGGGSGGGILLEAPTVTVSGSTAGIAVNGGGGGAECAAGQGQDGKPSTAVALGGVCTGGLATNGGNGAAGSTFASHGVDFSVGSDSGVAGGGGGGLGYIRVNTNNSFSVLNGAFISGQNSEGTIGKR
jgi:hypothetical protein